MLAGLCIAAMLNACGRAENTAETSGEESAVSMEESEAAGESENTAESETARESEDTAESETAAEGEAMAESEAAAESETAGESDAMAEGRDADREAVRNAYISALEDLYFLHSFPPPIGSDNGFFDGDDISDNKFAVYDIDQDGRDELIIEYVTTYNAGMTEIVYEFDVETGKMREEFSEYPPVTFYDNGIVEALYSHNHGMAGDKSVDEFWPYQFYRYDPESDTYEAVAKVDAWSVGFAEKDGEGNPFPAEIDEDGDGMVYYATPSGRYGLPMDGREYQSWRESYIGKAEIIRLPLVHLTEENIHGLK